MRFCLFAPFVVALPALAYAEPMTFDASLAHAEAQAPVLRARGLEADARRSAATAAGQLPDPRLGVGLDNFPVSGPPALTYAGDSMTMTRIGISQDVPNAAKRHAQVVRAGADIAAADAATMAEARRVRVATALAWIDLAYAERRLSAIDRVKARLTGLRKAVPSGVASGAARPAQALDIVQSLARLDDKRSELEAEAARSRASLARWTGDPHPSIQGDVPAIPIDPAALHASLDRHPDIIAAVARTDQAEADVGMARAGKRPDWAFDVSYGKRAQRYGDMVSAGVTISLPLFAKRRQDPLIAASVASAGAAQAEREEMRRALVADLESAIADHVMHHDQWMRAQGTLLPLARQRADLETASYAAGRTSLVDVVQAQSMLADTELELFDREAMVARDAARLVLTYGADR